MTCVVLAVTVTSCGEDQLPWCDELRTVVDLEGLASAISTGDVDEATTEVHRFTAVASEAPAEVRPQMRSIADALEQAVEVAMTGPDTDPDDLELRREAVNQQLSRVTSDVTAVSSWAETECGIRLD